MCSIVWSQFSKCDAITININLLAENFEMHVLA